MLVLKPGIQGNHLTGTASVPGLYIRFRDGIAEVKDEEMINIIKNSDGYRNGEFIAVGDNGEDPFADARVATEPVHIVSDMKYGHIEKRKVSEVPLKLPASVKKMIESEAKKLAKSMLPELLKEAVKELSANAATANKDKKENTVDKDVSKGE